ncbi:MAG TPA: hypothetical protein VNA25_12685 [Phycisphaerae bacterium]|nr:hypothetical protein [Phycisphaerae bacterium]
MKDPYSLAEQVKELLRLVDSARWMAKLTLKGNTAKFNWQLLYDECDAALQRAREVS